MKRVYALTDYKNHFGSKWKSTPYRSGYDKKLLTKYFDAYGFEIEFLQMTDVHFDKKLWKDKFVIYTSSEEIGLKYKNYIEDILLGLSEIGAIIIPRYTFLKANNNKVFMEILQKILVRDTLPSYWFGTMDELYKMLRYKNIPLPCVIKSAETRMSRGVMRAYSKEELIKNAKVISRSKNFLPELKELVREKKHKGYKRESKFQNKFIIQPLIDGLKCDWKVLIYWDQIYLLRRGIKKNDFRASGSGVDYKSGSASEFPENMFPYLYDYFKQLDVPNISIDFGYDGENPFIFETQAIYYGTSTQYKSSDFYQVKNTSFKLCKKTFDQEKEYVYSIVKYIENKIDLTGKV